MADSISTARRPRPSGRRSGRLDSLLAALLLLALAAIAAVVFLLALGLVDAGRVIGDEGLRDALLGWTEGAGAAWTRAAVASGALLLGLLSLWGLLRRLAPSGGGQPSGPASEVHVLVADDLGVVLVAREGIEGIARQAVQGSTGVIDAEVRVRSRGPDAVALKVDALVLPGADLQRAGAQARDRARESVERLVGLGVQEVSVRLEVVEPEDLERTVL